jgi:bifunctional N-acetylglucosamine-1-phosphate-uridyltransferase/glucosamine-1-phosphate-acetyltransferase GlmU-like protein
MKLALFSAFITVFVIAGSALATPTNKADGFEERKAEHIAAARLRQAALKNGVVVGTPANTTVRSTLSTVRPFRG